MFQNNTSHEYNYGIGIMKLVMAYFVVLSHSVECNLPYLGYLKFTGVPCFMICSFFYTSNTITSGSFRDILMRFKRLLIPFWIWSVLYAIKNIVFHHPVSIQNVILQFFCGISNEINSTLWFFMSQFYLILILWGIYRLLKKYPIAADILVSILGCLALWIQYNGGSYYFSPNSFLDKSVNMLVYAILGIFLYRILSKINIKSWIILLTTAVTFFLVLFCTKTGSGHYSAYSGAKLVVLSLCIFLFCYYLPIKGSDFLQQCAKCTLGVYCLHIIVSIPLTKICSYLNIQLPVLLMGFLVYFVSLVISLIIAKLPVPYVKKLVQ